MNAVFTILELLPLLHMLTLTLSLEDIFHPKPPLRNIFHYDQFHPKVSESVATSVVYSRSPVEVSARFPSFLPSPKLPPQPPPLIPDFLSNIFGQKPRVSKDVVNIILPEQLFTPNTNNEPAATLGQMENYKKDLEEKAMEEEQEQNSLTSRFEKPEVFDGREPKLFVSVNSGLYNYNYTV